MKRKKTDLHFMISDLECSKKDKRLLVLLALGTLILMINLNLQGDQKENHPLWCEEPGAEGKLFRISAAVPKNVLIDALSKYLSDIPSGEIQNVLKTLSIQKAIGPIERTVDSEEATYLSPRLSYYLGRPMAINRASHEELLLLPGIGPHLAGNMTSYRDQHGDFTGKNDLLSVPGIGPRILSRISPLLVFK